MYSFLILLSYTTNILINKTKYFRLRLDEVSNDRPETDLELT